MKILIRNKTQKEWQKIEPSEYANEAHLEQLLAESPDLLPSPEDERIVVFKRQVTLGSYAADLVGVSATGSITLVECKLDQNREARRMVVAQILEYAAQLWGMDYEEFDGLLSADSDEDLADLVREKASAEWLEEQFVEGVTRTLQNGDIRLVIAVNGITNELKRILEYTSSRGGLRLEALELQHFSNDEDEVLVPDLISPMNTESRTNGDRGPRLPNRTIEEVYAAAADPAASKRLKRIVEAWQTAGHYAIPKTSGISMRTDIDGKARWVFRALTPNRLTFNRRTLRDYGIPKAALDEFFSVLEGLSCADPSKVKHQTEPGFFIDQMTDEDAEKVVGAAICLVNQWKGDKKQIAAVAY